MDKRMGLLGTLVIGACIGCGPSAPVAPEKVPIELVPDGFTQDDCHFTDPLTKGGGGAIGLPDTGGMGGRVAQAAEAAERKPTQRKVKCHHQDVLGAPQSTPSPTSGEPERRLCSGDDGLLKRCDDEG